MDKLSVISWKIIVGILVVIYIAYRIGRNFSKVEKLMDEPGMEPEKISESAGTDINKDNPETKITTEPAKNQVDQLNK